MLFWHVPAPNEALLISGSKRRKTEAQFRIVTGHGSFVMPVKQKARVLSLALREAEIVEECITNQGIRLNVRAVAAFKIGDDEASIANAARRFLSEQDQMEALVGRIFAGHLRSIVAVRKRSIAKAASLREGNQELIAANRLIEILPSLVEAAARGLADSNVTILNGTEGVSELMAGLIGQGLTILETLKKSPAVAPAATVDGELVNGRRAERSRG